MRKVELSCKHPLFLFPTVPVRHFGKQITKAGLDCLVNTFKVQRTKFSLLYFLPIHDTEAQGSRPIEMRNQDSHNVRAFLVRTQAGQTVVA